MTESPTSGLHEPFKALIAANKTETVDGRHFITLLMLDSARYGVCLAEGDEEPRWAAVKGSSLAVFQDGREIEFVEILEHPRATFDETLEKAAADAGLPGEATLFSFPAIPLVRSMLARATPLYCRMALMWLLPTELRPLRKEIAALVDNELLPQQLRELAQRLVVPE